jgi:hypothetical protein
VAVIRCIYHGHEPNFPATDQHPDATRFYFDGAQVVSAAQWRALQVAARSDAEMAAYGVTGEDAIAALLTERGATDGPELKQKFFAEVAARMSSMANVHVVDAIGEPTVDEIQARLHPALSDGLITPSVTPTAYRVVGSGGTPG